MAARRRRRRLGLELSPRNVKLLADYRMHMERKGCRPSSIVSLVCKIVLFAE
jgi:hypothetical protein